MLIALLTGEPSVTPLAMYRSKDIRGPNNKDSFIHSLTHSFPLIQFSRV